MTSIKKWGLYFSKKNGNENRDKVAKAFHEFWTDRDQDMLWIDGKVFLGGLVLNGRGEILTSNVVCFERIAKDDLNGHPSDMMCATTYSGSKYCFFSDDYCAHMFMMLGDLTHLGRLNMEEGYYLPANYRGEGLL